MVCHPAGLKLGWGLCALACSHTAPARSKQSVFLLPCRCSFIRFLHHPQPLSLGLHMDALEERGLRLACLSPAMAQHLGSPCWGPV